MIQLATAVVMLAGMILAFACGFIMGTIGAKKTIEDEKKCH